MEKIIVLLHGFGEDHRIFEKQIAALSKQNTVLAPDLPGSGILNQYVWESGTEKIEWLAHWVNEQLESKEIEKCIMLGHSMGGYITLSFAEQYPEKLEAFGLIHSTAFADTDAKKEIREKAISFMEEKGPFTFLKTAIPGLFGPDFSEKHPEIIAGLVEDAKAFTLPALTAYYRAMIARPDRTHVLEDLQVPILLVAGSDDQAVPIADLLQQASIPAVGHFHILKDVGHMGMLEAGDALNTILLNFITNV
jgi:pimeloyl-ACP methyl ester carboxylesterase